MGEFSKQLRLLEGRRVQVSLQKKFAISRRIGDARWFLQGGGSDGAYAY